MPGALSALADNAQRLRALVPVRLVPALVKRRLDRVWTAYPEYRAQQEDAMRFLLEHTERAPEIPELAYRHAEQMLLRSFLRWHPRLVARQPVRGIEWLTTKRDQSRGVVLSFAHHNWYDGLWGSLVHAGAPRCMAVMARELMEGEAGMAYKQHWKLIDMGADSVPATAGTEAIVALLQPGATVAIASDVPGRTPVTFLGRKVLGSFGAARIATLADSPVVLVTSWRDETGHHLLVDEPLDPRDFDKPEDLLDAILRRHGEAVLAWPEVTEAPRARFSEVGEPTA